MQTLNAIANEDYYNATTSHDPWHCATNASTGQMSTALGPITNQGLVQSCSDHSLTTSIDNSPMLGPEDLFSSLDTAPPCQNPPSTDLDGTSGSGYTSSAPRRSAGSPSSSGCSPVEKGHRVEKKRQRNTEAARRYRQRKVDKVSELEEALQLMTKDRDDLRLRLARSEAEAGVLKGLVGKRN